jgi:hypothetical protein
MTESTPHRSPPDAPAALSLTEQAAWLVAIVAVWMVMHLYAGVGHDAILYTMQGLGHLRPDLWAQDIYLRFGSQDRYTVFTPLYALLMNGLGVEHAAELLTFLGQLAFFSAAWLLARALLPARQAFAGLLLLVALPGIYGAGDIFRIAEDFVTPRLLAESLVLAAILCWVRQRRMGLALFVLLALAIHPLMGMTAVALFLWLELALPRPRLSLGLAGIALAALLLVGWLANGPPLKFDLAWYQWVPENMPHVQIKHWGVRDWGLTLAPLTVLATGIALLAGQARQLLQAALGIGLAGIALTAIGADRLHLVLITQGQPWRCLWLSTTLATLLAPLIVTRLWRHSALGRAASLLLLAQYLLMGERYALLIAALSIGMLALTLTIAPRIGPQYQRLAFLGAVLVASLALLVALANYYVIAHFRYFPDQLFSAPLWLKSLRETGHNGLACFVLLAAIAGLAAGTWRRVTAPALLLVAVLACAALLPLTWKLWTRVTYQDADKALFASWRALIPPGSEVLFTENPLFVWIFLERPSYLSRAQLLSALFSRPAALVLTQRETALRPYLRAQGETFWDPDPITEPGTPTLAMACAVPDLQFVVSRVPLQATPIAEVPPQVSADFIHLRLYRCPPGTGAT